MLQVLEALRGREGQTVRQLHIDQGRMPLRLAWPAELPLPRAEQGLSLIHI